MTSYTVYLVRVQNEGVKLGVLPSPDVFKKGLKLEKGEKRNKQNL